MTPRTFHFPLALVTDRVLASVYMFAVLFVGLATPCTAADEPAKDQHKARAVDKKPDDPNLDDALLNDLDNELLEGAGNLRDRKKPAAPREADDAQPTQPKSDGEDLGMPSEDRDPLVHISQEMRSAGTMISERGKRATAEQLQRQIISELSKLVEQAEQQQAQQQSSSSSKKPSSKSAKRQSVKQPKPSAANPGKDSTQPAQDSSDRLNPSEPVRPDPQLLQGLMKNSWGHLPPRAREQMLQNSPEQFLPQYELMIEKYYKRLAEEQRSK